MVHTDASLIHADVSWDALARRWVETVKAENEPLDKVAQDAKPSLSKTGKVKKVCLTDPQASMATSSRTRRLVPSYRQHTAVCDKADVIEQSPLSGLGGCWFGLGCGATGSLAGGAGWMGAAGGVARAGMRTSGAGGL